MTRVKFQTLAKDVNSDVKQFSQEVQVTEASRFNGFQKMMEIIHSGMYIAC